MSIDNAQYSSKLSAQQKAAIFTMQKDMEVSAEVDLHMLDVIQGVQYLVSVGILSADRAARILSNQAPV
jgi:hypothetical protein